MWPAETKVVGEIPMHTKMFGLYGFQVTTRATMHFDNQLLNSFAFQKRTYNEV